MALPWRGCGAVILGQLPSAAGCPLVAIALRARLTAHTACPWSWPPTDRYAGAADPVIDAVVSLDLGLGLDLDPPRPEEDPGDIPGVANLDEHVPQPSAVHAAAATRHTPVGTTGARPLRLALLAACPQGTPALPPCSLQLPLTLFRHQNFGSPDREVSRRCSPNPDSPSANSLACCVSCGVRLGHRPSRTCSRVGSYCLPLFWSGSRTRHGIARPAQNAPRAQ